MAFLEGKTQSEKIKLVASLLLPLIALVLLLRMFFGSDAKPVAKSGPKHTTGSTKPVTPPDSATPPDAGDTGSIEMPRPVDYTPINYNAPEAARNIFAFYVKPVTTTPGASGSPTETPTPTPTPPPPLTLSSLQPVNVFARTGDFALVVTGDKFTPQTRIYIDDHEVPTTFQSAQQLSANVPASFVQMQGARVVVARTPDNSLYSNQQTVNVMPPPTPQFTFIGLIGTRHYSDDKAILKPLSGTDPPSVKQRGDIVGGRFKITSISDRAVEFTDTQLNIKHSLPYTDAKGNTGGAAPRAPQQADDDDGEP